MLGPSIQCKTNLMSTPLESSDFFVEFHKKVYSQFFVAYSPFTRNKPQMKLQSLNERDIEN